MQHFLFFIPLFTILMNARARSAAASIMYKMTADLCICILLFIKNSKPSDIPILIIQVDPL